MFCSKCGTELSNPDAAFCPKCGSEMSAQPDLQLSPIQRKIIQVSAGQRYPVLRWISILYKVCAVLLAIFGLISALGSCMPMQAYGMFAGSMMFVGLMIFVGSLLGAIGLWSAGEFISVFLDMEENLRKIADKP